MSIPDFDDVIAELTTVPTQIAHGKVEELSAEEKRLHPIKAALLSTQKVGKVFAKGSDLAMKVAKFGKSKGAISSPFISSGASDVITATSISSLLPGAFAIPKFCSACASVFTAEGISAKAKAFVDVVDSGVVITEAAADASEALASMGAVADTGAEWASSAGLFLFPIGVAFAGRQIYKTAKYGAFANQFLNSVDPEKVSSQQSLEKLQKMKQKTFEKKLDVPKGFEMQGMMKKLSVKMKEQTTKVEAETKSKELISNLRSRVKTKWWTALFSTIFKVVGIVIGILALAGTPLGQGVLLLGLIMATVGVGMQVYGYFAMRAKNRRLMELKNEIEGIGVKPPLKPEVINRPPVTQESPAIHAKRHRPFGGIPIPIPIPKKSP